MAKVKKVDQLADKKYKKNFLESVIIRIDFPSILRIDQEAPAEFQENIREKYPNFEETSHQNVQFKITEDAPEYAADKFKIYIFSNKEKDKRIELSRNFFTLEYIRNYSSFTPFFEDFNYIFKELIQIYSIGILSRIGLRYINQIEVSEGNPLEWKGYIKQHLISAIDSRPTNELLQPLRFITQEIYRAEHGQFIFQHGIFNNEFPNPIARKNFILDFDYFTTQDTEISQVNGMIASMNQFCTDTFENSIEDKLRDLIN